MDKEESTPVTKRIVLLPFRVPEEMEVSSMMIQTMPWQAVALSGSVGTTRSGPDTTSVLFGFEWPIQQLTPMSPMSQSELERIHLDRFLTDYLIGFGSAPFTEIAPSEPGQDPPDFTVLCDGRREGLDCAQITIESRRKINAMFRVIRDALLGSPRERFAHLSGHVVYMWFRTLSDEIGRPPKPSDRLRVNSILDALAAYRIDPDAFTYRPEHPDDGLPETFSNVQFDQTVPGTNFYAMPFQGAVPASMFFLRTGFEIGMAHSTVETTSTIWQEINRVVRDHDKSGIDHLVITVGGPDRSGFTFPSETYLTDAALTAIEPLAEPRHLKSIALHFWQSGRIVLLHPQLGSGPIIYPGQFSTAFFSATTTQTDPQGSSFQWLVVRPEDEKPSQAEQASEA